MLTINDVADNQVGSMTCLSHPGEQIRESIDEVGHNMTETAARIRSYSALAPVEWSGGSIGDHGVGDGDSRLWHQPAQNAGASEQRVAQARRDQATEQCVSACSQDQCFALVQPDGSRPSDCRSFRINGVSSGRRCKMGIA